MSPRGKHRSADRSIIPFETHRRKQFEPATAPKENQISSIGKKRHKHVESNRLRLRDASRNDAEGRAVKAMPRERVHRFRPRNYSRHEASLPTQRLVGKQCGPYTAVAPVHWHGLHSGAWQCAKLQERSVLMTQREPKHQPQRNAQPRGASEA